MVFFVTFPTKYSNLHIFVPIFESLLYNYAFVAANRLDLAVRRLPLFDLLLFIFAFISLDVKQWILFHK